jgi:hypothetical protein
LVAVIRSTLVVDDDEDEEEEENALIDFRPKKERENSQTESDPCLDPGWFPLLWTRRCF